MKKSKESLEGEEESAGVDTIAFESELIQSNYLSDTEQFEETSTRGKTGQTSGKVHFDGSVVDSDTFNASRTRSWTMPSLLNDRSNGARVAKLVASKRTPTGGFYAVQA